jgi:hypothetical protein
MSKNRALWVAVPALVLTFAMAAFLNQGHVVSATAAAAIPAPAGTPTAQPATLSAQDPSNDKTSATIDLQSNFIMDPYLLPVIGKGEQAASSLKQGCNGFVASQPGVTVNWTGSTDQLNFFVYSDDDPAMVIQQPDGSYVCNDDAGLDTVQPLVTIKNPANGQYKVFVGTGKQDQPALGFLGITKAPIDEARLASLDLSPMLRHHAAVKLQALQQFDPKILMSGEPALFGSAALQPGHAGVQTFAAGGGDVAAVKFENETLTCAGFMSLVPSYSFTWTGKSQALRLYFEALQDSSLAVITPDQSVLCGINTSASNLNPTVDITDTAAGPYEVYIGSMTPNAVITGTLTITSNLNATPAVLAPGAQR